MRPAANVLQLAACLSSIAPLAAAWPEWLPAIDSLVVRNEAPPAQPTAVIVVRQDDKESDNEEQASETKKKPQQTNLNTAKVETETESSKDDPTATDDEDKPTSTGKDDEKDDKKDDKDDEDDEDDDEKSTKTGKKKSKESKETQTTFAPNDPPGGVSMMTPVTTLQATPLFKIGDDITFAWNYTSLQGTPTAVDVYVSCYSAAETWTLTSNMTFETNPTYVWNSEKEANDVEAPLGVDMYTLIIKDSEAEVTDMPEPGYLGVYSGLKFIMYLPRPYTPLPEWECSACNSAPPDVDRKALGLALSMSIITFTAFTWFVTGLGLQ